MKRIALLTSLVAALAVVPAFAQQGQGRGRGMGMGPGGGPGMGMGPVIGMLQQLNLTDDQKQQIHSLIQANQPDQSNMPDLERKLHAALINGDQATLDQVKADLKAAHDAQLDAHIALMQKIVAILTPEQKQQLLNMAPPGPGRGRGRQ